MKTIWFKLFFRSSKKNWLNMVVNISGLALGLAGLLIVLLYLNDEVQYNAENINNDQIFRVIHKMENGDFWANSNAIEGIKYKEEIPEIDSYYLCEGWYEDGVVNIANKKIYVTKMLRGTPNFFNFFPFKIIEGSVTKFKSSRNQIAISLAQSKIFFGEESALGKLVEIANVKYEVSTVYKVVGKHYFEPKNMKMVRKFYELNYPQALCR